MSYREQPRIGGETPTNIESDAQVGDDVVSRDERGETIGLESEYRVGR
jgi:hypothetical protein